MFDERAGSDTEHDFIIFIMEVSNQFSWCCFPHILKASMDDEFVSVAEELKLLITDCFLSGQLSVSPIVLNGEHAWVGD